LAWFRSKPAAAIACACIRLSSATNDSKRIDGANLKSNPVIKDDSLHVPAGCDAGIAVGWQLAFQEELALG
jgi:hypothetical protein